MLDLCDWALRQPRGARGTVLDVLTPVVMGHRAKYLRESPEGRMYGLTRRQVRAIRKRMIADIRADLDAAAAEESAAGE